jgi:hypothetical protein
MIVHQLLHGYKRGHQLLSANVQLDSQSIELVTRLSDLSGSMTIDSKVRPYLTCYPLPNQKYYAIGKTWLDDTAPRTGCVLTHTLIIPMEYWSNCPYPSLFNNLFIKPMNSDDTERYHRQLDINVQSSNISVPSIKIDRDLTTEFVFRFFGEGINPIIWYSDEDSEDTFWLVAHSLWPQLRRQFACCTFCLQPRYLDEKPFTLMFAPSSSNTRFQQIPRENIIDRNNLLFSSPTHNIKEEPWVRMWANHVIDFSSNASNNKGNINQEMFELGPFLSDDPTDIKKIYLVRELRKRSMESPMAGVGLLDMIESIAQNESAAIDYKERALTVALESVHQANDIDEVLKCLLLISDRFSRKAYSKVNSRITSLFYKTVSEYVLLEPNGALKAAERLFTNPSELPSSPYLEGLVIGLVNLGTEQSVRLKVLRQYPDAASQLIGIEPRIGVLFLNSEKSNDGENTTIEELTSWVANISDRETLDRIKKEILPEVKGDQFKSLTEELLRQLSKEEIYWVLDTLSKSTNGFKVNEIRTIICEKVSKQFPIETREWAIKTNYWSSEAAYLLSATYSDGLTGIIEIIQTAKFNRLIKAQILAASILEISQNHSLPQWFQEFAKINQDLIPALMPIDTSIPVDVSKAIKKVLDEVWELPLVCEFQVQEFDSFISTNQYSFSSSLISSAMRSAVSNYITGNIDWQTYQNWESTSWGEKWISNDSARDILLILSRKCLVSQDAWLNSWKWLAYVSEEFYQNNASLPTKLIESLLSSFKGSWVIEVTSLWILILQRIHTQSKASIYIQACANALYFAFRFPRHPISQVVVEAFLPVYKVVIESKELPPETYNLFGYFDWDKGKELRKKIIDTYINSSWPPGDLALSVRDKILFRKIYSRIRSLWKGKEYIQSMQNDLSKRSNDPVAKITLDELNSLLNEQNFYESWD